MDDRHRDVALFRYSLIREAADPALTKADRGLVVRALAARDHTGPGGERVRISRNTLERWIRNWRAGGYGALVPRARSAGAPPPAAMLDLAVKLKHQAPGRTAAQVAEVMSASEGWGPSARAIQRLFARLGLNTRPDGTPPEAFGRFKRPPPPTATPLDWRRPCNYLGWSTTWRCSPSWPPKPALLKTADFSRPRTLRPA